MSHSVRSWITHLCLLGLLFGLSSHAHADAQRVTVAHWGHEKILIYAPLYIAIDGGFFDRAGLNVKLLYSGNDDQVFAAVVAGSAQFGVGDPVFTAISRERGGPGKVVAALVGRVANWALAEDKSIQPFDDPAQLNGRRVTSFPSPSTTFTILSGLKKSLALDRMTIIPLAFGTELAALRRGEADLAIMLEPQASIAEAQGSRVVWSLAQFYGDFALTGVTTTDSFIQNSPDTVQRFVSGLQDALDFAARSPEAAAALLEDSFPTLDSSVVRAAMRRMVRDETLPRTVVIDRDAWIKTLRLRQSVGDLRRLDTADASIDSSFAEKAAGSYSSVDPPDAKSSLKASADFGLACKMKSQRSTETDFWKPLSLAADALGVVSFSAFLALCLLQIRQRAAWKRLPEFDKDCGPSIRSAFPNRIALVSEDMLAKKLHNEKGRSIEEAKATLQRFHKAGILKQHETKHGRHYSPRISALTNSALLFEFWDN